MFLNASSITSWAGGFVSKLTTIVNIADTGTAINITSINGHGATGNIVSIDLLKTLYYVILITIKVIVFFC